MASGASAGLSAAFNAPLAGVIFAVEEIFKYFSPVVLLSTMVSRWWQTLFQNSIWHESRFLLASTETSS